MLEDWSRIAISDTSEVPRKYAHVPQGLIAVIHVVAVEFATIAAANYYWRK